MSAVLYRTEEAVLSDRQDVPDPDQGSDQSAPGGRDPGHARLQEGRARDRGGEALPQSRAESRVQRRSVARLSIIDHTQHTFMLRH